MSELHRFYTFLKGEQGVTAIEYAVIVAGVAACVLHIFGSDGPVQNMLLMVMANLSTALGAMLL